jgi:hypothetical protein
MFATVDAWDTRHLHATAIRAGVWRPIEIPRRLRGDVRRALTLPSQSRLRALARELVDIPSPDQGALEAISIQVFRTRFDPETLAPSGELLRHAEVRFDGGG